VTATENKKLIQDGFESWARGGDFFHLVADDVRWTISGAGPISGTYTNKPEFIAKAIKPLADKLAGPIVPTIETIVAEGDFVVVVWSGKAKTRDGRPYNNHYSWIMRLVDGKIKESTAFFDNELISSIW
jgi:uncharacterized protein